MHIIHSKLFTVFAAVLINFIQECNTHSTSKDINIPIYICLVHPFVRWVVHGASHADKLVRECEQDQPACLLHTY